MMSRAVETEFEVVVIGAGPGGYAAAFRSADLGRRTLLVERAATLGGVCLNVGCIPSKALLHVAAIKEAALALSPHGVRFAPPEVDLDALRAWKDQVVGKLTGGLVRLAKARKVEVWHGTARFTYPHTLEVQDEAGVLRSARFQQAIIATGSAPVTLPFLPQDPRILDSTGALALTSVPARLLVVGGGVIGLEMATVYASLGSRIDVVEMSGGLMGGADRDLVKVWEKHNAPRLGTLHLDTRVTAVEARPDALWVKWVDAGGQECEAVPYDALLVAVGRTPNSRDLRLDALGVTVDERGFIPVDRQQRTVQPHIFAIGDVVGQPMLAHKATHEGHVAAEVAAGLPRGLDIRQIPAVAYTDPEVAWTGLTETEAQVQGVSYGKAVFPWGASGRALANGRAEGLTKILFDEATHRVLGGGIVGTAAGDLIGELSLAVEMGADATDLGRTIHPHPTLGETVGLAAELYEGVCTDLPPLRQRPLS